MLRSFSIRRLWWLVLVVALMGCEDPPLPQVGDSCTELEDCLAGFRLVCEGGACARATCTRSVQCPLGAACVTGFCDQPQCEVDRDCAESELCFEGACRDDLCTSNADCGIENVCSKTAPRTCVEPPVICTSDEDCPDILRCSLPIGECVTPCSADTDCARERYCAFDQICRADCIDSSECPNETICAQGRCVETSCSPGGCEAARPFRDPATCGCVECLVDVDCAREGEACLESGTCTFCPRRGSRQDCESAGLVFNQGCCSDCIDDVDCSVGSVCARGRCRVGDPRECEAGDCGAGEACDNGTCRPAGSLADCVAQADCPDGEACYGDRTCRTEAETCGGCPAGSRCIAEIGDSLGACVGCPTACDSAGCPEGQLCVKSAGTAEGFCEDALFSGCS